MQKLHLVGFTSDLRYLILSRQKGVRSGGFSVSMDDRLRSTLEEVARLRAEDLPAKDAGPDGYVEIAAEETPPPRTARQGRLPGGPEVAAQAAAGAAPGKSAGRSSLLTPKEIQSELRAGRTVQEVARIARTETSWVERFLGPILAERKGIVEAVQAGVISRPRLGRSSATVAEAILAFFGERRIGAAPEDLDEGWKALRRDGLWEVTFQYDVRGELKEALFSFDVETRVVKALNPMAYQIAWRPADASRAPGDGPSQPENLPPAPAPLLRAKATPTQRPAAGNAKARGRGDAPPPKRNLWVSPQEAPAAPGRSRFLGLGKADAARPAAENPAARPSRTRASPQGAGPSDDNISFARNSIRRPQRLLSQGDAEWKAALAKTRAARKQSAAQRTPPPPPQRPSTPRPQRKRLPDDWLLDD